MPRTSVHLQWLELQPRLVSAIQKRQRQQSSRMRVSMMKNRKEGLHSRIQRIERPKAAHSVRECEARVPARVHASHGRPLSVMIPIIEAVAVPTSR